MLRSRLIVLTVLLLGACAKPGARTAEELRTAIAAYEHGDATVPEDRIDALFARLDADVAELRAQELATPEGGRAEVAARRAALDAERRGLQQAYLQARVARVGTAARKALEGLSEQLGQKIEETGRSLRESAHDEASQ